MVEFSCESGFLGNELVFLLYFVKYDCNSPPSLPSYGGYVASVVGVMPFYIDGAIKARVV